MTGLLFLLSCTPESCLEETEAYLKASFFSSATKKATRPDSLTVFGFGIEGKVYSGIKQLSMARLPLNAGTGSSNFIIKINAGSDTLLINYSNFIHLISKECGYTYFHRIDSIRTGFDIIDSIKVINPAITNGNEENIRIYF